MNLYHQFVQLEKRKIILQDGIELLTRTQLQLKQDVSSANAWGFTAVMSNVVLVPLNVIINAFDLKSANDLYKTIVKEAYNKFAKSGTRTKDDNIKTSLAAIKKVAIETLKRKGLVTYVPGVNILVGLAEDSVAAFDSLVTVQAGTKEMNSLVLSLEKNIKAAKMQLMEIGRIESELIEKAKQIDRTA